MREEEDWDYGPRPSSPPVARGSCYPPAPREAGHLGSGGLWDQDSRAQKEPGGRGECRALPVTASRRQKNTNQFAQI